MDSNALIDKFLQERIVALPQPPQRVISVKELSPYLCDVNPVRARLGTFSAKQAEREKKHRAGTKKKARGSAHYKYRRRLKRESDKRRPHAIWLKTRKDNQQLIRKYRRMLRYARDEKIEGPHMSFDEYMLMWLTKVPKQMVKGELVHAHLAMGNMGKIGGLCCKRIDVTKGFTIDNVQVMRNLGAKEYELVWKEGTNE